MEKINTLRKLGQFKGRVKHSYTLIDLTAHLVKAVKEGWLTHTSDEAEEVISMLLEKIAAVVGRRLEDPVTPKDYAILTLRQLADRLEAESQYEQFLGFELVNESDTIMLKAVLTSRNIVGNLRITFPISMKEVSDA